MSLASLTGQEAQLKAMKAEVPKAEAPMAETPKAPNAEAAKEDDEPQSQRCTPTTAWMRPPVRCCKSAQAFT